MNDLDGMDSVLGDFARFVENFDAAQKTLSFVHTSRQEIARESFLDPRWRAEQGRRRSLPMNSVITALSREAPPRLNFIWHTSFCCSTLLARALDRPGRNLSLREPLVLVSLADTWREGAFANGLLPEHLPAAVLRLLARSDSPQSQVTVKPSNFVNVLAREAARISRGKALFLYSDLLSFLVSVLRGGVPMQRYARRLFMKIASDVEQTVPWPAFELLHMSDLEIAALAWHLQMAEFRRSLQALGTARAASLNCAALLGDPASVLRRLDEFLNLGLEEEHVRSVVGGGLFEHHAKFPQHLFDANARSRQFQAIRRRCAADIEHVIEWSFRVCPATPLGTPLPNALQEWQPSTGIQ